MMTIGTRPIEPRVQAAIDELAAVIRTHHPTAQFAVSSDPDDASTILLEAILDVDDPDAVLDLIFGRMEQLRIDEGVPILVLPLQTPERAAALFEATQTGARTAVPAALL